MLPAGEGNRDFDEGGRQRLRDLELGGCVLWIYFLLYFLL
jgi:hypothetical protein